MDKEKLPIPNLKPEDLKPGDILLFPPNALPEGWVGQAIVLLTKGTVSHSALYWGEKEGVFMAAHAAPKGIGSVSFPDLVRSEPGCFVRRRNEKEDPEPVLKAIDGYTDHENSYPFFNLAVLGLLMLANRFLNKTLRNRIFYDFALLVSAKLMKAVQEYRHPGKSPMSCSQFVAQCYTDAGDDYDIKFVKLLVQFGELNTTADETSLFDLLGRDETLEIPETNLDTNQILSMETDVAERFIEWMKNNDNELAVESAHVDEEDLNKVSRKLLKSLCQVFTGTKPASVKEAIKRLSTNRNYFVTPEDLLSNASNLETIGYIDRTAL